MAEVLIVPERLAVPVSTRSLAAFYGDFVLIWWDGTLLSAMVGTRDHPLGVAIDDDGAFLNWAARPDVRAALQAERGGGPVRLCRLHVEQPPYVVVFWRSENASGDVAAVAPWADAWKILERETSAVPAAPQ